MAAESLHQRMLLDRRIEPTISWIPVVRTSDQTTRPGFYCCTPSIPSLSKMQDLDPFLLQYRAKHQSDAPWTSKRFSNFVIFICMYVTSEFISLNYMKKEIRIVCCLAKSQLNDSRINCLNFRVCTVHLQTWLTIKRSETYIVFDI